MNASAPPPSNGTSTRYTVDETGVYFFEQGDADTQKFVRWDVAQKAIAALREEIQTLQGSLWDTVDHTIRAEDVAEAAIELSHQLWVYAEALRIALDDSDEATPILHQIRSAVESIAIRSMGANPQRYGS